jgi:hypothetical protein
MSSLASGKRFPMLEWMALDRDTQLLGLVIILLIVILLSRNSYRLGWPR